MDQRISLITLGVADLRRAVDFYSGLGWEGRSPDGDVAFFQAGGMVFALWGRDKLAAGMPLWNEAQRATHEKIANRSWPEIRAALSALSSESTA